jgi:hypothetical protein
MFDHKPVYLNIGARVNKSQVNSKNKKLTNWFLDEKIIEMSVALSALQILSHSINAAIHPDSVTQIRNSINFLTNKLLESLALLEKIARNCGGDNKTDEMLLGALYAEFYANSDLLPSFDNLFMLNSMYSKKEVFISLTDRIAEKVSALQIKFKKFSNISKKTIEKKLWSFPAIFSQMSSRSVSLNQKSGQ